MLVELGWCVGKIDLDDHKLTIFSPSDISGGAFLPANDVIVAGEVNLKILRGALIEAYPLEE